LQASNEQLLRDRVNLAFSHEHLEPAITSANLVGLIQALWHGLSAQSNQGVNRAELLEIATAARGAIQNLLHPRDPAGRQKG
ncbi:MAG: hypothetical protein WB535_12080, partial [Paenarthrobacter sp.]